MDVKCRVLADLVPHLPAGAIIATNTSSLSVTELGRRIDRPACTIGMHFFNPAPLMQLVEVVAGGRTDPEVVEQVAGIAATWGKRVARAADVPGFIVNHVARPYYLEAFRILEDGYATVEEIDAAMTACGGFRMGPLALTDLIGQDVNAATTQSVWQQLDRPPLLRPCRLQAQLIRDGHLGRKTGRGVYDHHGPSPVPAVHVERRPLPADPALNSAVQAFADAAVDGPVDPPAAYVLARILAALILQARLAHRRGVAGPEDIDIALRYGTNYPAGPFEWSRRIGADRVAAVWSALDATMDDDRFAEGSD
jgi:3-hydroxybutyryl-CoA dehydrogenase